MLRILPALTMLVALPCLSEDSVPLPPPGPQAPVLASQIISVPNVAVGQYGFSKQAGDDCEMDTDPQDVVQAFVGYGIYIKEAHQVAVTSNYRVEEFQGGGTRIGGNVPEKIAYTAEAGWKIKRIVSPGALSGSLSSESKGRLHSQMAWKGDKGPFKSLQYRIDSSHKDDCSIVGFDGYIDFTVEVEKE